MKVELKWGKRSDLGSYDIDENCLARAYAVARSKQPYSAWTKWSLKWDPVNDTNPVKAVTVTAAYEIITPNWTRASRAPAPCREDWDRTLSKLMQHEEGHRDLFVDWVSKIAARLRRTESMRDEALRSLIKDELAEHERIHDRYHKEHGNEVPVSVPDGCSCDE